MNWLFLNYCLLSIILLSKNRDSLSNERIWWFYDEKEKIEKEKLLEFFMKIPIKKLKI